MTATLTKKMTSSGNAAIVSPEKSEMLVILSSEIQVMVIRMATHTMIMRWKLFGEEASMRISECSTLRPHCHTILKESGKEIHESATVRGNGSVRETTVSGSADRESEKERESANGRRRAGAGRRNGRGIV